MPRLLCLVLIALGAGLGLVPLGAQAAVALQKTPDGILAGVRLAHADAYLGIPYAQAPVGTLRWRTPLAPLPWDGLRSAAHYGPLCPQNLAIVEGPRPPVSEDCLTLNVWTPRPRLASARPVIVWLHGGGYFQGGSSQWPTDGTRFAERGVVLVSANFRLGALGFLAHPALSAEAHSSGNYGLADQIAVLRWVQANIAAFGGDPANVTVMGQSSGATTATALMTSAHASGLLHKVILMSGGAPERLRALRAPVGDWSSMEALGEQLTAALFIARGPALLERMRAQPWPLFDGAWRRALADYQGDGTWHHLIVDGALVTEAPGPAFRAGRQALLPMLIGVTANEGGWFARRAGLDSAAAFSAFVRETLGAAAVPQRLAQVRRTLPTKPSKDDWLAASAALISAQFDATLRATALAQRARTPQVTAYRFERSRIPAGPHAALGDYHSAELPYVFDQLPPALAADAYHAALADELITRWIAFAATGLANPPGYPAWSALEAGSFHVNRAGAEPAPATPHADAAPPVPAHAPTPVP